MKYDTIKVPKNEIGRFYFPSRDVIVIDFDNDYANKNKEMMKMHTHDFYIVSFVEQGSRFHHIDMDKSIITDNTLMMIAPGEFHYTELGTCSQSDIKGVSINIPEEYFMLLPKEWSAYIKFRIFHRLHQLNLISSESINKIKKHIIFLKEQVEINKSTMNEIGVYAALTSFLNAICHTLEFENQFPDFASKVTDLEKTYMKFRNLLESDFCKNHYIQYYSKELGISLNKLNASCQAVYGLKATEVINKRLLLEAKKLIRYTNMQGKEIAVYLGFTDRGNFLNWFKKQTGLTTSEFKQRTKDSQIP